MDAIKTKEVEQKLTAYLSQQNDVTLNTLYYVMEEDLLKWVKAALKRRKELRSMSYIITTMWDVLKFGLKYFKPGYNIPKHFGAHTEFWFKKYFYESDQIGLRIDNIHGSPYLKSIGYEYPNPLKCIIEKENYEGVCLFLTDVKYRLVGDLGGTTGAIAVDSFNIFVNDENDFIQFTRPRPGEYRYIDAVSGQGVLETNRGFYTENDIFISHKGITHKDKVVYETLKRPYWYRKTITQAKIIIADSIDESEIMNDLIREGKGDESTAYLEMTKLWEGRIRK